MQKRQGGQHRGAKRTNGPELPVIGLVLLPPQGMSGMAAGDGGPDGNKKDEKSPLKLDESQTSGGRPIDKMYSYFKDLNDINTNWIYEVEPLNMNMT